ncbi:hypothetical protein FKM82_023502 [Ascaphus truei]
MNPKTNKKNPPSVSSYFSPGPKLPPPSEAWQDAAVCQEGLVGDPPPESGTESRSLNREYMEDLFARMRRSFQKDLTVALREVSRNAGSGGVHREFGKQGGRGREYTALLVHIPINESILPPSG